MQYQAPFLPKRALCLAESANKHFVRAWKVSDSRSIHALAIGQKPEGRGDIHALNKELRAAKNVDKIMSMVGNGIDPKTHGPIAEELQHGKTTKYCVSPFACQADESNRRRRHKHLKLLQYSYIAVRIQLKFNCLSSSNTKTGFHYRFT